MPRGENPNSQRALAENRAKTMLNGERAVKAGIASGESRRKLKSFRELDADNTTDDERLKMLDALKLKAKRGNLHAFEIYRDTMGMKPKESVEVSSELYNPYAALTEAELKRLAKDG